MLEKIFEYGADWIPGYGIYHLFFNDERLNGDTNDLYLLANGLYHSLYVIVPMTYILIKK